MICKPMRIKIYLFRKQSGVEVENFPWEHARKVQGWLKFAATLEWCNAITANNLFSAFGRIELERPPASWSRGLGLNTSKWAQMSAFFFAKRPAGANDLQLHGELRQTITSSSVLCSLSRPSYNKKEEKQSKQKKKKVKVLQRTC